MSEMSLPANLSANITQTVANHRKLSMIIAKTTFHEGYNLRGLSTLTSWMWKDPIKYGSFVRNIQVGLPELGGYVDQPTSGKYEITAPKPRAVYQEAYNNEIRVVVKSQVHVLQEADKFDSAAQLEFMERLKAGHRDVINGFLYLLLLACYACCCCKDADCEACCKVDGESCNEKCKACLSKCLEASTKDCKQVSKDACEYLKKLLELITQQSGTAKINTDVTWNEIAKIGCEFRCKAKNRVKYELSGGTNSNRQMALFQLYKAIVFEIQNLSSEVPRKENTRDKDPSFASNCPKENLILVMNANDYWDIKNIYFFGATSPENIREVVNIDGLGIGLIVPLEDVPCGWFDLADRNFFNVHGKLDAIREQEIPQHLVTLTYNHYWFKIGFLSLLAGKTVYFENFPARKTGTIDVSCGGSGS